MLFSNISLLYAFFSKIAKILGETNEWNFNMKKNARVQRKVKCKGATRPDLDINYQKTTTVEQITGTQSINTS